MVVDDPTFGDRGETGRTDAGQVTGKGARSPGVPEVDVAGGCVPTQSVNECGALPMDDGTGPGTVRHCPGPGHVDGLTLCPRSVEPGEVVQVKVDASVNAEESRCVITDTGNPGPGHRPDPVVPGAQDDVASDVPPCRHLFHGMHPPSGGRWTVGSRLMPLCRGGRRSTTCAHLTCGGTRTGSSTCGRAWSATGRRVTGRRVTGRPAMAPGHRASGHALPGDRASGHAPRGH